MQKFSNKTLMILGAGQLQLPIISAAKAKGVRIVVVTPSIAEPGVSLADEVVQLDVRDENGILKAARKMKVDGITTDQTDLPVRTVAYVAEKMGLPGIGYDLAHLFTDKYQMRKRASELGTPTPKFTLIKNAEDAKDFFLQNDGRMIIKPIDSQSSHGVSKIDFLEDISKCFEEAASYSRTRQAIIEEYIEGAEFSADSIVNNGNVTLLSIGEYHPFSIDGAFSSYMSVFPANQTIEVMELIRKNNEKIIKGFNLKNGRTHAEYIISGDKCFLIEIAARGGGAYFSSNNVRYVSGFNTEEYLINTALGIRNEPIEDNSDRCFCCCTLFFYLPEKGVIETISGVNELITLPYIKINNLYQIKIGQVTKPIIDKGARFFMVVQADNYEQLNERVDDIRNRLIVFTRMPNGALLPPIWF